MERIAIITPCILPVPATKGGAVEGLINRIVDDNERYKRFIIDLFVVQDAGNFHGTTFKYTNIIPIKRNRGIVIADKVLGKIYGSMPNGSAKRVLDYKITSAFFSRLKENGIQYHAVIFENMMSFAVDIIEKCQGIYDFPVYFHLHNDIDIYRSPKHIQKLVSYGVVFIAVSNYIKEQILKCNKNAVVSVLYNGVNLETGKCGRTDKEDFFMFLYAGRIIPVKGVIELVLAFIDFYENIVDDGKRKVSLCIYGFSGIDRRYERKVLNLINGFDNIICYEQIPAYEMMSVYDTADVVLMPSIIEEAFGQVALEAMSKGKALIVTDSGALPEIVEDGGVIVTKKNDLVTSLSWAMKKLFEDKKFRCELQKRGFSRAHDNKCFDIKNYYNNFLQIIDPIIPDDKPLVSIIVPVYNTSIYLNKCLNSLVNQTYKNLEIILVDDGSTDKSGFVCDEFAKEDKRIKVIHQTNQGLSAARNMGIDSSSGRYIFFCDSDDFISEVTIEFMMNKMVKDNAEVVACGFSKVYDLVDESGFREEVFTDSKPGRWSGRDSVIQMMRGKNICSTAWNKLYKAELFKGVRFPIGFKNEDEATVYKVLDRATIVSYTPNCFYKYVQRNESIMHDDMINRYIFFIKAATERLEYYHEKTDGELEQYTRIALLEWIKYSYRKIDDRIIKRKLLTTYSENVTLENVPTVLGLKKSIALLLWKYVRY